MLILFLDLGAVYMGMFTVRRCIKLITYDLCTSYIHLQQNVKNKKVWSGPTENVLFLQDQ